jgi:hypothetical protein
MSIEPAGLLRILLIVILPIIGTILYFALRPTLPDEAAKVIATRTERPFE